MQRAVDRQIRDSITLARRQQIADSDLLRVEMGYPAKFQKHPTLRDVWVPTDEHPDVGLTPKQIFEKYGRTLEQRDRADREALLGLADEAEALARLTCGVPPVELAIPDDVIPLGANLSDTWRILREAGAYRGMLCTSAIRDAVAAVMRAESIDGHIYGAFYASAQRLRAMDALRELIAATKVPVALERLSQVLGIPVDAPAKPLPAMVRVIVGKDGKMETEAAPAPIDIERVRRETRDHITGNGKPWFTDPNAAPPEAKAIGVTAWCEICKRNVTGEPCVTVYAGAMKGCFTASGA